MNFTYLIIFWLISFTSCNTPEPAKKPTTINIDVEELKPLRHQYITAVRISADKDTKFLDTKHCDSLLWTSLAVYGGHQADLTVAEQEPGKWLRRPVTLPECYSTGGSRSEVSRDMIMGVMWASRNNRSLLERIWSYGDRNGWFMGQGRLGGADTLFTPPYIGLLADMLARVGGQDLDQRNFEYGAGHCSNYECHLLVLRLHLRGLTNGYIPASSADRLRKISEKYPDNPLFHWVSGYWRKDDKQMQYAVDQLAGYYNLDQDPFCEWWPMQQNGGEDNWERCEEGKDVGGGFLFVSKLMLDAVGETDARQN